MSKIRWPTEWHARRVQGDRALPVVGEANANEQPLPKIPKYRNEKTGQYASKREAMRAADLDLLEQAGEISELREQVVFLLIPSQKDKRGETLERACTYIVDFLYLRKDGKWIYEDVKSKPTKTPAYIIKRKLMLFVHGIRITEV